MTMNDDVAATVSDSEIQILQLLWRESPLTAQEIIQKIQTKTKANPQTVKTLINRLFPSSASIFLMSAFNLARSALLSFF